MTGQVRRSPARQLLVLILLLLLVAGAIWLLRDQLPFLPNQPASPPATPTAPGPAPDMHTPDMPDTPSDSPTTPSDTIDASDPAGLQSLHLIDLPGYGGMVYVEYRVEHNQRKAA